jgi:aspartyl/asparaginyl beta-hydroxylase (cupin superfamily)
MHNTKTYATINLTDIGLIDFAQVGETSVSTVRKSLDNITDASVIPVGTYDHHAILELMQTDKWSEPTETE